MNEIANKFLLAGNTFMPKMHLRQPEIIYDACGSFTIKQRKNTKIERNRGCMITKTIQLVFNFSDKKLHNKAFNIAKNLKFNRYQCRLASLVYNFFDKKPASLLDISASGSDIKGENVSTKELAEKLHKSII